MTVIITLIIISTPVSYLIISSVSSHTHIFIPISSPISIPAFIPISIMTT